MIRFALIIAAAFVVIIFGVIVALARGPMPMIPFTQPGGSMTGPGGPMIPGNVGGGGPPACSNSLDFTQACNSQYIGAF